jgi:flagellar biosynthesis component FlhA
MMKSQPDSDRLPGAESTLPESLRYRLDVVFAAAALTVLAGLLIPIPVRLLDMAWIGGICLAAAVVVISAAAKSCHDLQGFGFLAGALVLLRISLTAMTIRKILVEHTASTVIDILGKSVHGIGIIGAAMIALLLAIVGFGSLFPAAGWTGGQRRITPNRSCRSNGPRSRQN